jgi:hypothetical protein
MVQRYLEAVIVRDVCTQSPVVFLKGLEHVRLACHPGMALASLREPQAGFNQPGIPAHRLNPWNVKAVEFVKVLADATYRQIQC